MNALSSIFVDLVRRSWVGPVIGAMSPALFFAPQIISKFDLLTLTPLSPAAQDMLLIVIFCAVFLALIAMAVANQIASARIQPSRSGLSTFERIHADVSPPRADIDLLAEPMQGVRPPAWMRALGAPVPSHVKHLGHWALLIALLGSFFLTLAPQAWVRAAFGDDLAADIPRGLTALGLILLASLLFLRARCAEIVARSPSRRVRS